MPSPTENFLFDVIPELIKEARDARAVAHRNGKEDEFAAGRALAYYEVVSYLIQELDAFGISRASVQLDHNFDPDRELI